MTVVDSHSRRTCVAVRMVCCALTVAAGCLPIMRSTLVIPIVRSDDSESASGEIELSFAELAPRMDGFDPNAVAVYVEGREPWPFVELLRDASGSATGLRIYALSAVVADHADDRAKARDFELIVVSPHPSVVPPPQRPPRFDRPGNRLEADLSRARR